MAPKHLILIIKAPYIIPGSAVACVASLGCMTQHGLRRFRVEIRLSSILGLVGLRVYEAEAEVGDNDCDDDRD